MMRLALDRAVASEIHGIISLVLFLSHWFRAVGHDVILTFCNYRSP